MRGSDRLRKAGHPSLKVSEISDHQQSWGVEDGPSKRPAGGR